MLQLEKLKLKKDYLCNKISVEFPMSLGHPKIITNHSKNFFQSNILQ